MGIYMWREFVPPQELHFIANTAGSTVTLNKYGSPTSVTLEKSTDGSTWSAYTIGTAITLANVGDIVCFRNTSTTTTGFSTSASYLYYFTFTGSVASGGDINYLINKNSTNTITTSYCFNGLFSGCNNLTSCPKLTATTLTPYCYYYMFYQCSNLETLPKLEATSIGNYAYQSMFNQCSKIKLSTTQTGDYQTAYRIPTTGTGTTGTNSLGDMFASTGGTFKGTPSINTTYYTSNTVV